MQQPGWVYSPLSTSSSLSDSTATARFSTAASSDPSSDTAKSNTATPFTNNATNSSVKVEPPTSFAKQYDGDTVISFYALAGRSAKPPPDYFDPPHKRNTYYQKTQLLRALFGQPGQLPGSTPAGFSRVWYRMAGLLMYFLPEHYPDSVNAYYLTYSKWVFVASILGTASSVLSMQCLLTALGLGAAALPASAAINWVLKDGLGQLGGMLFASLVSTRFDIQPIRYRLLSAIILDLSVLLEILTPLVPALFLPLASLANIGKNIAWLGASASRAAIHRSFLKRENLADLTAKSGSQTILASLIGTALGIGLSLITGSSTPMILVCFVALSFSHLLSTYRAVRGVVINHLTSDRLNILSRQYLSQLSRTNLSLTTPSHHPLPHIHVSTPAELQQSEPVFWLQHSKTTNDEIQLPHWSGSSISTNQGFYRLVDHLVEQPNLMLSKQELDQALGHASASPATIADPSNELYAVWVKQFETVPFIVSLSLVPRMTDRWNHNLSSSRLYAALQSELSPLLLSWLSYLLQPRTELHLSIRLLYKTKATTDDILTTALYLTHLRQEWQRFLDASQPESSARMENGIAHIQRIHAAALTLMSSPTSSDSTSTGTHANATITVPMHFLSTLQRAGYATNHHFVEDDNVIRIKLKSNPTISRQGLMAQIHDRRTTDNPL